VGFARQVGAPIREAKASASQKNRKPGELVLQLVKLKYQLGGLKYQLAGLKHKQGVIFSNPASWSTNSPG
jgi:hypothetical protein